MATNSLPASTRRPLDRVAEDATFAAELRRVVWAAATFIASLKLTVTLFSLAIVIVWVATLAQRDLDMWDVIYNYFWSPIAWLRLEHLFPWQWISVEAYEGIKSFGQRTHIAIPFPGGYAIGFAMAINLVAAHLLRFKTQAKGGRLAAGVAVIALGGLFTYLVIAAGHNPAGEQTPVISSWDTAWTIFKLSLVPTWLALGVATWRLWSRPQRPWPLLNTTGACFVVLGATIVWLYTAGAGFRFDDSSMRILWQILLSTLVGVVLLVGSVLAFGKRGGIVVIHLGIGLLMFGELFVSWHNVEEQMSIREGETVNFARDIREVELAVIDPSPAEYYDTVVVPGARLRGAKGPISHADLPFDVEVVKYFKNADLRLAGEDDQNPATAGVGLRYVPKEVPSSAGADADSKIDYPAAYIRLRDKSGGDLGVRLVSLQAEMNEIPERVSVDGKTYEVWLRFKRNYKPYSIHLVDVRKDDYLGTSTPRDYSSDIVLNDPANGVVDRQYRIWMNNPLRYSGETFYQSSYHNIQGVESTTLQVVTNTGWMIPYVSCMIVVVGLGWHFSLALLRFLDRRERAVTAELLDAPAEAATTARGRSRRTKDTKKTPPAGDASPAPWYAQAGFLAPLFAVALGLLIAVGLLRPPRPSGDFDLVAFGRLPLVYEGRVKPYDTLARNTLRIVSDKETYVDENGDKQPAVKWLLDVIARPDVAAQHEVFRIQNPDVLTLFGLDKRKGHRYSLEELRPAAGGFTQQAQLAGEKQEKRQILSVYERQILQFDRRARRYMLVSHAFDPPPLPRPPRQEELQENPGAMAAWMQRLAIEIPERDRLLQQMQLPLAVPVDLDSHNWRPLASETNRELMRGLLARLFPDQEEISPTPATMLLERIFDAYANNKPAEFNQAVAEYDAYLTGAKAGKLDLAKVRFEHYFNHSAPFMVALFLYALAFAIACCGFLGWSRSLNRAALALIIVALIVHTLALVARIYISGRPPVTNLYSSAVFIGWGCVVLGIILEWVYRLGIGNVIATIAGFATLIIAHQLAADGDTFAVLVAVLDTQFWLATHVTTITLGYSTTFLAGLLGAVYLLLRAFRPVQHAAIGKDIVRMMYGVLCFALFFSFFGTVLGGLWADDSWGRFWGWDPKENGALLIVLWNAIILHSRWDGMIKERGMAALAIGGNIVTSWSWFGVNQLGVGLHSYGFTDGVVQALSLFVLSQLLLISLAWWPVAGPPRGGARPAAT